MAVDRLEFRKAMGCYATGVTVITAMSAVGNPVGMTVNSFNSVSLDPPLVLFSLDRKATHFADFMAASYFAVNILAEEQQQLSRTFSTQGIDRWNGISYERWETGSPILPGTLAAFDCVTEARHDGGDHIILVGRVLKLGFAADGTPLLYYRGKYDQLDRKISAA
jgi:flavin reductase (DIM6/NTAB) family NADH-FMN oxidoreductase RutF